MLPYTDAGAVISGDGLLRWHLWREWDRSDRLIVPRVLWIMLNPSTADGLIDDPTIRRCCGFARSWGYRRIDVVNLFSWRATKPAKLKDALSRYPKEHVIGPGTWTTTSRAAASASLIMCAWGALGGLANRDEEVLEQLIDLGYGSKLRSLGLARNGQPRHPLFVPASAKLEPFGYAGVSN